jgi:hypothetical protein
MIALNNNPSFPKLKSNLYSDKRKKDCPNSNNKDSISFSSNGYNDYLSRYEKSQEVKKQEPHLLLALAWGMLGVGMYAGFLFLASKAKYSDGTLCKIPTLLL